MAVKVTVTLVGVGVCGTSVGVGEGTTVGGTSVVAIGVKVSVTVVGVLLGITKVGVREGAVVLVGKGTLQSLPQIVLPAGQLSPP